MCWKYKNPHRHVFIWCEIVNGKEKRKPYRVQKLLIVLAEIMAVVRGVKIIVYIND